MNTVLILPNLRVGKAKTDIVSENTFSDIENAKWINGSIDYISAKDFGAVGDGVTDDTTAIQAWASSTSKNKFLPEGTFLVNSMITCSVAGAVITGGGVLKANTVGIDVLKLTADNQRVSGIEIDGNSKGRYLIWATGATPVVDKCYLHDAYSTTSSPRGINIENNPGGGIIANNRIYNITAVGNASPGDANGAARAVAINGIATPNAPYFVYNNDIRNILGEEGDAIQILFYSGTGTGYPIEANAHILDNEISNVSRRFIKIQASKCRVSGNILLHDGTVPALPSNSIDIIQSNDVGVLDNRIDANPLQLSISVQGVSGSLLQRCVVARNIIKQDDAKAWASIYSNYAQQCVFSDNIIWGGTNSVTIGNSDNCLIANNKQYGGANASVSFNANSTNTNITTAYNISMNLSRTNVTNSGTGARII